MASMLLIGGATELGAKSTLKVPSVDDTDGLEEKVNLNFSVSTE